MPTQIGVLKESSLHAALKKWYARPGDVLETPVEGYLIDIQHQELLIEIQTGNFYHIRRKLAALLEGHTVRLVFPLAQTKWIVRTDISGKQILSRRKSPKKGRLEESFFELVRIPDMINHPRFSFEIILIEMDEFWRPDGRGSWRRKHWSISDRRLGRVISTHRFNRAEDLLSLLPKDLPDPFTSKQLSSSLGRPYSLGGKMAYCLRQMGMLEIIGKRGNAYLYSIHGQR
jgi:hypothetical protein